jgi:CelD/BcsL family acetyltransferase involved in cellulose biosynthesis
MATTRSTTRIRRIPYEPAAWDAIVERYPDVLPFHGSAWLAYLAASQGAEPVVAAVEEGDRPIGHFVGAIVRRYGIRILGSPLRGWGTQHMGFLAEDVTDRRVLADALLPFAFQDLRCLHVELGDLRLMPDDMTGSRYTVDPGITYQVDLAPDEGDILKAMRSTTRNYVRQAERKGLTATFETADPDFAPEYFDQLGEVFGRQGLGTTYGLDRVQRLIEVVGPSGDLALLRILAPDGRCIATSITVGRGRTAILWGAAFRRADADLHPNELLHWAAMRHWRARGATTYDMGGGGEYKAKFGAVVVQTPRFRASRFGILDQGRGAVRRVVRARQVVAGRRRTMASTPDEEG